MLSMPLLKRNMASCGKVFLIIFAFLVLYTSVIIYMFNPELSDMLSSYQEALPDMMAAVGMTGIASSLLDWIRIYLYGFIMLLFPLIFIIIVVNKLLMNDIERGALANLLATPNSRAKLIRTQLFSLYLWLAILMAAITAVGLLCSRTMFPGELDVPKYLLLNLGTLLLWFAVAGITFLAACIFSESRYYYLLGAGLPILFFLFRMLGNMGEKMDFFRYLTLYSLLPAERITAGEAEAVIPCLILLGISAVFSACGAIWFTRRDFSV